MLKPLSPQTISVVKATVPALAEHGSAITRVMYERLLRDPDIRLLFNHANQGEGGAQVHALAAAILAYAQNIENLQALMPAVERISQKHIGYHILPEHYPFVATALLGAIKEVLGEAATEEILTAWGEAYWFLAEVLKAREVVLRNEIEHDVGGWHGWRRFVVADKIVESEVITSFVLRPEDGLPVTRHKAGQYLTFRLGMPGSPPMKRNYSISCGPNNDHYRISVKREERGNGGSRYLHDHVDIGAVLETTPPAGDFFLADSPRNPVVLLSGGVGLTPMVSMIESIAESYSDTEAYYVHGTISGATHAMDAHVRSVARGHGNIKVSTFYSNPRSDDVPGENHDVSGMITLDWLAASVPMHDADFYLCGPKPFLRNFVTGLAQAGVPASRIHYEFFGPADALTSA